MIYVLRGLAVVRVVILKQEKMKHQLALKRETIFSLKRYVFVAMVGWVAPIVISRVVTTTHSSK